MIFFKVWWHLNAIIWKLLFKIIYYNRLKLGGGVTFRKDFTLLIDGPAKVSIGDRCFFNNFCSVVAMDNIIIGNDCIFGENVKIYDHNHRFTIKGKVKAKQGYKTAPIVIKDNCWIANDVVILKGVTIGENCVIGAGCIIKEDIPPDTVVTPRYSLDVNTIQYRM